LGGGREVIRDHLSCQKKQKEPCQLINSGQTARTVEIRAVPTAGVARRALPNRRPRFILHLASQKDFTKKTSQRVSYNRLGKKITLARLALSEKHKRNPVTKSIWKER
jgi:hypothetical protein